MVQDDIILLRSHCKKHDGPSVIALSPYDCHHLGYCSFTFLLIVLLSFSPSKTWCQSLTEQPMLYFPQGSLPYELGKRGRGRRLSALHQESVSSSFWVPTSLYFPDSLAVMCDHLNEFQTMLMAQHDIHAPPCFLPILADWIGDFGSHMLKMAEPLLSWVLEWP